METGEPTVELIKEYKEQLMAAAAARDKVGSTALLGLLGKLDSYPYVPRERSALGLAVGRLREHETPEVSEKAKALVARWVASVPARKRQESPSKSTQISQKGTTSRVFIEPATVGIQCDQETFDQKDLSLKTATEHGEGADIRKLARTDTGNTKKSASMSVSARSVSKVSNAMSIDDAEAEATRSSQDPTRSSQDTRKPSHSTQPKILSTQPKPPTPPTRTFETDGLGDASALHEVPLRALTIELFYDALAAGAGNMPPRSLLPKAMSVEDVIYLDTAASLDDYDENAPTEASARTARADAPARPAHRDASARPAHTDAYVRTAHSAFIALSSASDISTMRSDLLKGDISAEDFVDYILGEEEQVV
ncbi:hypothetical protein FB107DRAFT_218781 [Schizophyllum commune]